MKKIITKSDLETINLGEKLGKLIKDLNIIVLLEGDLASGKTTFTKGIAKGLGINKIIKSPTFNILKIYEENGYKLNHLDLYRLSNVGLDFDLEEYIYDSNATTVIEWPNQVKELLPKDNYIHVKLINNINERTLIFSSNKYSEVVNKL